jgi:hypothetical protein
MEWDRAIRRFLSLEGCATLIVHSRHRDRALHRPVYEDGKVLVDLGMIRW